MKESVLLACRKGLQGAPLGFAVIMNWKGLRRSFRWVRAVQSFLPSVWGSRNYQCVFFFSPICEVLLPVSHRLLENGEEDGSSAECSASTWSVESVMLVVITPMFCSSSILLLPSQEVLFQMLEWSFRRSRGISFLKVVGRLGKSFHLQNRKFFPKATSDSVRHRLDLNLYKSLVRC